MRPGPTCTAGSYSSSADSRTAFAFLAVVHSVDGTFVYWFPWPFLPDRRVHAFPCQPKKWSLTISVLWPQSASDVQTFRSKEERINASSSSTAS